MHGFLSKYLKRLRLEKAARHCYGSTIDVGCYHGDLYPYLDVDSYMGVEIDKAAMKIAQKKFPDQIFKSTQEVQMEGSKFDCVVSIANIGQVSDQKQFLSTLLGFCKNDGIVIVTCAPPIAWQISKVLCFFRIIDPAHRYKSKDKMLNLRKMRHLASSMNANVILVQRFLFGLNQLFIVKKANS